MDLSELQLHTLRHMLGINTPERRIPEPYRNYAAVNLNDPKFSKLERIGVVEKFEPVSWSEFDYYRWTEEGILCR